MISRNPGLESDQSDNPYVGSDKPMAFGLIVIGDEILNGNRQDRHLAAFKGMISARGHQLGWCWILPDEP
ncbi:MAG: hypothetical protein K9L88_19525, partial [Chromatiaceae bacterium]|nr:hypothetical protein [Chromatiaceae bacterium]